MSEFEIYFNDLNEDAQKKASCVCRSGKCVGNELGHEHSAYRDLCRRESR